MTVTADYANNVPTMKTEDKEKFKETIKELKNYGERTGDYPILTINGGASSNGSNEVNNKIAAQRAENVKQIASELNYPVDRIVVTSSGERGATLEGNAKDGYAGNQKDRLSIMFTSSMPKSEATEIEKKVENALGRDVELNISNKTLGKDQTNTSVENITKQGIKENKEVATVASNTLENMGTYNENLEEVKNDSIYIASSNNSDKKIIVEKSKLIEEKEAIKNNKELEKIDNKTAKATIEDKKTLEIENVKVNDKNKKAKKEIGKVN